MVILLHPHNLHPLFSSVFFLIGIWISIKHGLTFNFAKLLLGNCCKWILWIFLNKLLQHCEKEQRMVVYYLNCHWRLYKKWSVFLLHVNQRTSCSVDDTDINIFYWTWIALRRKRTGI
jgi:hypothetical protein